MESAKKKEHLIIVVTVFMAVILFISIIPVIISSFYCHPYADDFHYSGSIYHAVNNGQGPFGVLSACSKEVCRTYMTWQGTYSAIFVFCLQPGAFSDRLYFITTIVILTSLILSTVFFIYTVFREFKLNTKLGLITSFIILFLSIQFVFNKYQAFFWWNGCTYYTLFYSFSLLLFAFLIKMYFASGKRKIICFAVSILLAAIIGGGNYSTALSTTVILFTVSCLIFLKNKKQLPYCLIILGILAAGFIISMAAPGNNVRAGASNGLSAVNSVIGSVVYSILYIFIWTDLSQISGFIIIGAIAFAATKGSGFKFRYPLLILILSFLIFATQLTPPLYGIGYPGSERQINIYYYSYYLLISFNIFYICGWINHKKLIEIKTDKVKPAYILTALVLVICLFFGGCIKYGAENMTFFATSSALTDGTAKAYSDEYSERLTALKNGQSTISEIDNVPCFLTPLDISSNPDFWINQDMASYFGLDEITRK
ncbi:MAG: DUF6056 family protein [Saccharofermentans sp.]|nr:DUF6056 family protein [Saccharofermentans sp.]